MRVVFITQAVNREDPVLPHTPRWIEALATRPDVERVAVLALRTGRAALPANVDVYCFGRSNRAAALAAFYRGVARALRSRPDVFFVHQGGPYPGLLLPVRLLARIPVVQWKTHGVISRAMTFYARRCDDLVFTATPASFPLRLPNVRVVGHGIDTEAFRPAAAPRVGDLIAVGRIAPMKRVEEMVRAVEHANRTYGAAYRLDVYGPTLPGDGAYAARVERLIDRLGAGDRVRLHGPVRHDRLAGLINGHRAGLNFTGHDAADKAALEVMACGLPVVSTNASIAELLPPSVAPLVVADWRSTEAQGAAIHALLARPDAELAALGARLRAVIVAEHGVDRLFDRILVELRTLA
jgi:glycosyltransferase involved in cell wall biosynthesis